MIIKNWKMDFEEYFGLDCTAPCDMYSVLYEHGYIDDPYYGLNEATLKELSRKDCTFRSVLELSESDLGRERIELCFLGLDTICDIYFNGVLLDSVKNMHRKYEYDIKPLAKKCNDIRLEFKSPVLYFEKMNDLHFLYTNDDTIQGASHLRKALYMSGWDWGPTLPNMGIFRDVIVNAYDTDAFEDFEILQHHENGTVRLEISASTKHGASGTKIETVANGKRVALENGKAEITIENPRLWWPNGYGKQELYDIELYLYKGKTLLDKISKKIGLRTLYLSQEKDELGSEFCFKVNGVKIFSMGANYVPIDSIPSRITNDRLEALIKDCIFANFNSIRVWGGAFYPCDYFYDLCDKYGLIVWQDFMVACANIWLTEDMEKEFYEEAIYNVKRIRYHASLGILCGNNEMEEAIVSWECAQGYKDDVRRDYLRLYEDILPSICKEYAPQASYTPSSPTSGGGFDDPKDFSRGDVHFWHVWNGNCGFDEYRKHKPRFCSEYGFESLPSIKTINEFCPQGEQELLSSIMVGHQKHWDGNKKLYRYLIEQYNEPKSFEGIVYATQLNQANAIKYGVEHFRRCRGYTMGSIYWQLNDSWPVASWSSIDYFGRYKALHYFAKKFYAPVALGLFNENWQIAINVANEKMSDFKGKIRYGVLKNDLSVVFEGECEAMVGALSSSDVIVCSSKDFDSKADAFFYAELFDENGILLARNTELGVKPKDFELLKPEIKLEVKKENGNTYIYASSNVLAKNVEISFKSYDIVLSDNYFDLTSTEPYKVLAYTELDESTLANDIKIMSVYDI